MAKRINSDGTLETVELPPEVEAAKAVMKAEQKVEEAEMRVAERRLAEAKARRGPKIERVEIEGEEWFCARLDWPGINRVLLDTPRNADGEIDRASRECLTGFTAALIFYGTFEGADEDSQPSFGSLKKAREYVEEPNVAEIVVGLYVQLTTINPMLDQKKKAADSKK